MAKYLIRYQSGEKFELEGQFRLFIDPGSAAPLGDNNGPPRAIDDDELDEADEDEIIDDDGEEDSDEDEQDEDDGQEEWRVGSAGFARP